MRIFFVTLPVLLILILTPVTALLLLLSALPGCSQPSDPWSVVSVRERLSGEVPFEESSRYLWPSPDANNVPGPDSLVVRVITNEEHHPYVWLEDLRTGKSSLLLDAWASLPHWSPDGKYITCVVWKSRGRPHELTVVDVATRTLLLDPEVGSSVSDIKWAPDSRTIAADGVIYGRPKSMLYTVTVPEGKVTVLDSLDVLAHYEVSWSPNGRWIAFSRPTVLDHLGEDPVAADLWVADPETGKIWPILETPDWVESNPLWITDNTILIERVHWDGIHLGIEQQMVVELSREISFRKQD